MLIGGLSGFRARKAAQIAAYFAAREGRAIEKLKLIKLMYLAEREFARRNEVPMLMDEYYSLKHGPICSNALDGINGTGSRDWNEFITRSGREVSAAVSIDRDTLDEVSDAEMEVLEAIWSDFGAMDSMAIRSYTHRNCPEYTEVESGRLPIDYHEILSAVGVQDADELARDVAALRRAQGLFAA